MNFGSKVLGGAIGGLTLVILGAVGLHRARRWRRRKQKVPDVDLEQKPDSVDSTSADMIVSLKVYKVS
jgi:hypothetical protein